MTSYLIINHISKKGNVKDMCATAVAHGFHCIIVGGFATEDLQIQRALACGLVLSRFDTLAQCKSFLVDEGVPLFGLEIMETASSILDTPFPGRVAIMPGNEGSGMSEHQKSYCDSFVYIPQYGLRKNAMGELSPSFDIQTEGESA